MHQVGAFMRSRPGVRAGNTIVIRTLAVCLASTVLLLTAPLAGAFAEDAGLLKNPGPHRLPIMTWPGPDAVDARIFRLK